MIELDNRNKAILLLINAALFFGLMGAFVKLSGNLPAIEKSFFRNIVSLVVSTVMVIKSKAPFFGHKGNRFTLLGRVTFGTIGLVANFYAINHLVLADANMLNQMSPFFVIIFSSIFLKEKISKEQILMMLLAFIGGICIIRPSFSFTVFPALVGLSSAVCAGVAYTYLRYLGDKEKSATIIFLFSSFSVIAVLPFMYLTYVPISTQQLIYLLIAGVFASIAQFSITIAYRLAPAKEISIYAYTQIIFVTILGYFMFGQIPDKLSFLGYAIVILASVWMFRYNKRKGVKDNKEAEESQLR